MIRTGLKEIELKLPCAYSEKDLDQAVRNQLNLKDCSYRIIRKSLDSRRKDNIHWQLRLSVSSAELPRSSSTPDQSETGSPLKPERKQTKRKALIAGTGPAGIFAALFLQRSGVQVTLLERGKKVDQRLEDIRLLEQDGRFTPDSNYCFGEGGAGTFSDGKLTSRSKHIRKEKSYILEEFVRHGAPGEILYLTHPHIGSDNLIRIARNMRRSFMEAGGDIHFGTTLEDLEITGGRVRRVLTASQEFDCDYVLLATGHSSYDTTRMLLQQGIPFRAKNFALGCRMEHKQEQINRIQWGRPSLPGVKAAEYRLSSNRGELPVYSFCMCPGGKIVPAGAYENQNIVNGMSFYQRDGEYANAALVAGISLSDLTGRECSAGESLNWLESLEKVFFEYAGAYRAPAMTIPDFMEGELKSPLGAGSYQPGLLPADLTILLPPAVSRSLQEGLKDLCRRLPGFEDGQIMGLESKTSSPVQVIRDKNSGLAAGTDNLFICGEGSGYAGGIISSASDGLRSALAILDSL